MEVWYLGCDALLWGVTAGCASSSSPAIIALFTLNIHNYFSEGKLKDLNNFLNFTLQIGTQVFVLLSYFLFDSRFKRKLELNHKSIFFALSLKKVCKLLFYLGDAKNKEFFSKHKKFRYFWNKMCSYKHFFKHNLTRKNITKEEELQCFVFFYSNFDFFCFILQEKMYLRSPHIHLVV